MHSPQQVCGDVLADSSRSVTGFIPDSTNSGGQYISADEFREHRLVNPARAFGPAEIDTYTYSDGASSSLVGFRGAPGSDAALGTHDVRTAAIRVFGGAEPKGLRSGLPGAVWAHLGMGPIRKRPRYRGRRLL
jgi:hypothetical protein